MSATSRKQRLRLLATALSAALVTATLTTLSAGTAGATPRGGGTDVDRQEETGRIGFIGTAPGRPIDSGRPAGTSPAATATSFLQQRARELGLDGERAGLAVREQHATAGGGHVVRMQQEYAGIPVFGGQFTVNLDDSGDILSVLGEASPIVQAPTKPSVPSGEAAGSAVAAVAKSEGVPAEALRAEKPRLVYYDARLLGAPSPFEEARLAWVAEVTGRAVAHTVVVDALLGSVALDFSSLAHAKDRIVCDAGNTTAQYPCTAPVWTESSQPATGNPDVQLAFEYAGDTYDFFADHFGRDSLDDNGMTLISTVDYCPDPTNCPFQNAFWDGSQMVYGDGFAVADDVVGHELAHGVTDHSSSLFYYMQSGAINEAMSDIFGELIDLGNASGNDDPAQRWLLGEDVPGIGAIRDLQHPPAYGDPDRMQSPLYEADAFEGDGGGVHVNSGVANKAAYLLVDGDTFNGQTVAGIGVDKTALLFYTVNNDMLVSGSDYADLANSLAQACTNLIGTSGFTASDCTQVERTIAATEMRENPGNSPTSEAVMCPTGVPDPVLSDDLETDTGQLTVVPITGPETWSYPQNPNDYAGYDATYATSGDTNIWGDDPGTASDSALRMSDPVTVPAGAFLHFRHAYGFEDGYDGGVLEYSTSGAAGPWTDAGSLITAGGYNDTVDGLGGRNGYTAESNGYGATRADLSALAGEAVMFRWRIGTDSTIGDYGWFIDDISVHTCVADTTAPNTSITAGPANGSTIDTTSTSFAFTATEAGSTFQCSLDNAAYAGCTSPEALTGLSEGSHTFRVRATDSAGNTDGSAASRTFTVDLEDTTPPDTTAPDVEITKHPKKKTKKRKATFKFRANEANVAFECKLDKKRWKSCTSPEKYKKRQLKRGKHTFKVRATDEASNRSRAAKWKWKIKKKRRRR